MKLIIYNGSPRGKKSNTKLLMDEFIKGMYEVGQYDIVEYYLASKSQRIAGANAFGEADKVILAFPLYTDSMPGIVKEFIEELAPYRSNESNPDIGFVVQSGFPEPAHSRHIQQYLERLAMKLNSKYLGTIVKGGVEGIQIMPGWMTKKLYGRFRKMGIYFGRTALFSQKLMKKLAPRELLSKRGLFIFKMMQRTKLGNFYWNGKLKENGVYEQRFAKPFAIENS